MSNDQLVANVNPKPKYSNTGQTTPMLNSGTWRLRSQISWNLWVISLLACEVCKSGAKLLNNEVYLDEGYILGTVARWRVCDWATRLCCVSRARTEWELDDSKIENWMEIWGFNERELSGNLINQRARTEWKSDDSTSENWAEIWWFNERELSGNLMIQPMLVVDRFASSNRRRLSTSQLKELSNKQWEARDFAYI